MARPCHAGAVGKVLGRLGKRRDIPGRRSDGRGVKVPGHIRWLTWRLVLEGMATLQEVETYYDLVNVLDANEALDLKEEAEHRATDSLSKQPAGLRKRR